MSPPAPLLGPIGITWRISFPFEDDIMKSLSATTALFVSALAGHGSERPANLPVPTPQQVAWHEADAVAMHGVFAVCLGLVRLFRGITRLGSRLAP